MSVKRFKRQAIDTDGTPIRRTPSKIDRPEPASRMAPMGHDIRGPDLSDDLNVIDPGEMEHEGVLTPGSAFPHHALDDRYQVFDHIDAGICVCDETDTIRYVNTLFRNEFLSFADGLPVDFTTAFLNAVRAGRSIKLSSANTDEFGRKVRERRRSQVGSLSFMADAVDGKWWRVTDTKLDNGWMVAVAQELTALKTEELKLRDAHASAMEASQTDFLTGVPNRRAGLSIAQDLFAASRKVGGRLTVAVMDIDHFKRINDVHGHAAGDRALVHFSGFVARSIASRDHFSRIGGEEFLLVSTEQEPDYVERLLSNIMRRVPPLDLPDRPEGLRFTVSAGVAAASPNESWQDLFHRADLALYQAKAKGRDRLEQAQPGR